MDKIEVASPVVIEGDGIAAVCVARLLTDAGIECVLHANPRPKLAAILLGEQTQHMLQELFPPTTSPDHDLFAGFARIKQRIVLWGDATAPLHLSHAGVVAPEGELLRRLWQQIPEHLLSPRKVEGSSPWRIQSSRIKIPPSQERCFGNREARIAQVQLCDDAEDHACWVESVEAGWLFLLSTGAGNATLIAVGGKVDHLLSQSRLVGSRIVHRFEESNSIAVYPRLRRSLVEGQTIFCGSAAMNFDPLCGEGAGNAVREAFLAAAVIRAGRTGTDSEKLADHYTARLTRGFLRHLQACLQFYETGGDSIVWLRECDALRSGITSLQLALAKFSPPIFKLVDRDLVQL